MEDVQAVVGRFQKDKLVTVTLDDGTIFYVQEPLLCTMSEYFRKALDGDFQEGHSKTLRLPGCGTNTFESMLYWMTSHKIKVEFSYQEKKQAKLSKLWAAGEMYLLPQLQNDVAERLLMYIAEDGVIVDGVASAFEHTSEDSKLRELYVGEVIRTSVRMDSSKWNKLGCIPGFLKAFAGFYKEHLVPKLSAKNQKNLLPKHDEYLVYDSPREERITSNDYESEDEDYI